MLTRSVTCELKELEREFTFEGKVYIGIRVHTVWLSEQYVSFKFKI